MQLPGIWTRVFMEMQSVRPSLTISTAIGLFPQEPDPWTGKVQLTSQIFVLFVLCALFIRNQTAVGCLASEDSNLRGAPSRGGYYRRYFQTIALEVSIQAPLDLASMNWTVFFMRTTALEQDINPRPRCSSGHCVTFSVHPCLSSLRVRCKVLTATHGQPPGVFAWW